MDTPAHIIPQRSIRGRIDLFKSAQVESGRFSSAVRLVAKSARFHSIGNYPRRTERIFCFHMFRAKIRSTRGGLIIRGRLLRQKPQPTPFQLRVAPARRCSFCYRRGRRFCRGGEPAHCGSAKSSRARLAEGPRWSMSKPAENRLSSHRLQLLYEAIGATGLAQEHRSVR